MPLRNEFLFSNGPKKDERKNTTSNNHRQEGEKDNCIFASSMPSTWHGCLMKAYSTCLLSSAWQKNMVIRFRKNEKGGGNKIFHENQLTGSKRREKPHSSSRRVNVEIRCIQHRRNIKPGVIDRICKLYNLSIHSPFSVSPQHVAGVLVRCWLINVIVHCILRDRQAKKKWSNTYSIAYWCDRSAKKVPAGRVAISRFGCYKKSGFVWLQRLTRWRTQLWLITLYGFMFFLTSGCHIDVECRCLWAVQGKCAIRSLLSLLAS